ncbi:MAG: uncharacterized protein K0S45_2399 [Nitrospira sp.]|jgi:uncharacterized protein YoxC|nr:uncharacterized protein [Nitrospira sp.]
MASEETADSVSLRGVRVVVEVAAILVAIAFAVLVGYLIPLLIQIRKTVAESEQLVAKMNSELPLLITELRTMSQNLNGLTDQARDGVEHASVLLHAVGEVGESVNQVHSLVKGSGSSLMANVASIVAGLRAAKHVVKKRCIEGGHHHGG